MPHMSVGKAKVWALDRWSDAASKAIFVNTVRFAALPRDLTGIKRVPASLQGPHFIGFTSERMRRLVACESGAELKVFSWLERSREVRWYQEQPAAVPYTLEGCHGYYYPDAAVLDRDGRVVIVEVKPAFMMYRIETLAKAVAALDHFGPRGIGYLLVDPAGRTIADLARADYDREIVSTIEPLFAHGPVSFRLVRDTFRLRQGRFDPAAFASLVVNGDWAVTSGPGVRISKLPQRLSFRALLGVASRISTSATPLTAGTRAFPQ
jgi:hypothetical protein